jgi:DNA-3-methyladenine glycosylase II
MLVPTHNLDVVVAGPWSLATSRRFWEGFAPAALPATHDDGLYTRFLSEEDWTPATATVRQDGDVAHIEVTGDGDLDAAVGQVARFLSLDVDATRWPDVCHRDPVIARAQAALPGFRPCGFHSPYEAAAWAVLSQRTRMSSAAAMRRRLASQAGEDGAFPAPEAMIRAVGSGLQLPGRKAEYLANVASAALDGLLYAPRLKSMEPNVARKELQTIPGIGPFAADLILVRGANSVDVLPLAERRLRDEITCLYGTQATLEEVSLAWLPFRSWASVHLRAQSGHRMQ